MSTLCLGSALIFRNAFTGKNCRHRPKRFVCKSMTKTTPENVSADVLSRRSGNYKPSPWDHRYLLSINNEHAKEEKVIARDLLKEKVRKMLDVETKSRLEQLELIDELQKLGVSYHFEVEINDILMDFHHQNGRSILKCVKEEDLHATALEFRLLRQHGFDVSEDIFDVIIDKIESETFKSDDINSIISLYEASYLSTKSDIKLREVIRPFATEQIRKFVDGETCNLEVREKAIHALEMPYHWRMRRLETRWYIDAYEKKHDTNLVLIEFAKIDFNIVQIAHQEDLKYASSWWKETCLVNHLPFVRDRIVENYFVAVGIIYEPQFGNARRIISIVNALVTTIDDIYDIYGTLEELEIFTAMVDNWDVNRLDELPEYMRLCFLILYNEVNSIGCDILKDKHINVIPFLKKSWADLCKTYLVEAKWYKKGYKPTVKEYIQNAWISISGQTILIHFYCGFSDQISVQILETLAQHRQDIVRCSATILRLANDLATSPAHFRLWFILHMRANDCVCLLCKDELARGDVLKSVQCYMHETGATEEEAQAHVQQMICDTWEEMNYEAKMAGTSSLPRGFVEAAMNVARMAQCIYQYGDGHGCPEEGKTVERFMYLVVNPVTNTKVISLLS
ncbi:1,8-cineole synthase 1, chloroplastic-like isoform X1 [Brassica rapa]|uniref:1,8-cineole synthase 1, chloroplastic-like isoform X1 n=1 Tax=Brassica napus TaxID=3708 RepID=UPI0006AB0A0D|nr:1,8-cineole synthase 1, chloroplastic-like isoform X1 [Brassica napus]XP_033128897.1 1,8-cineole synthase 1, chloroplastic-like isoform X1 [Brassica rapa]XP_048626622.1 1,8-cineole synthase 1, chloroplastic-like isoform X1 [Brassica napus]